MSDQITRIDIAEPLRDICTRLGVHYESVAQIVFKPDMMEVTEYLRNDQGSHHLDESGALAHRVSTFQVQT